MNPSFPRQTFLAVTLVVLIAAALALLLMASAVAQTPVPTPGAAATPDAAAVEARAAEIAQILHGFHPKVGAIELPGGAASLKVPAGFCYLDVKDSRQLLVNLWHNPPSAAERVLGMLLPMPADTPDVRDWGVVITYQNEGYVKDGDADKIDYAELLKKLQAATAAKNEKRQQAGYPPAELVGWAAPPRYDHQAKKLYWAQEYQIGENPEHSLNYDIRILGRRGVLSLNAVAGMDQLQEIEQATPKILSMVNFNQGHRYADFDPKTDHIAEIGLAGLVAGGLLLKAGGLKALLVAALAMKKFIIIGVAAAAGYVKKLFGGRGVKTHETPSTPRLEDPKV